MAEKEQSTLDNLKKLEERKNKVILAKVLNELKDTCEEIIRSKALCVEILKTLKIDDKESKQILDWVNSLVELSEDDKQEIKQEAKELFDEQKKKVEKELDNKPYEWTYYNAVPLHNNCDITVSDGSCQTLTGTSGGFQVTNNTSGVTTFACSNGDIVAT